MKNYLLTFSILILSLALSTKTNAQADSGGFSNGPEASQVEEGIAVSEIKIAITNYPNPIINNTTIKYTVPANGLISLKVYNSAGSQIATIYQGYKAAGTYHTVFNASKILKGIYVCRLSLTTKNKSIVATRLLNVSK